MRWMGAALCLMGCGGSSSNEEAGRFDLESYCQAAADCTNAFLDAYRTGTTGYTYDAETCVQQWEAQRAAYAGGPCEEVHGALEDCIATAEHLVCVNGSYASGACTVEALDVGECLLEAQS